MTQDELIVRFCRLATKVGDKKFKNNFAHDCFCSSEHSLHDPVGFQFEEPVIEFIENAVDKELNNENKTI